MADFWQNKKIIVYIALPHHTRFISPVMERLSRQGAEILYIVGQAERSQEITAVKLGLNYSHVFDFVTDQDSDDIQTNYLQLRDALSGHLKHHFLLGSSPLTVIDKTLYSTAVEYIGFRNLLKKEKPDLCFALHELNRWGKIFAFWSKKLNIPVITFQEGLYYGLDFGYTGHVQYTTLNLVWGKRIKKKLTDFEAPGDRILPVGNTHLANEIEYQRKNAIRKKKRKQYRCKDSFALLLLISGEIPSVQELYPLFESVADSTGTFLFIKFHPITPLDQMNKWVSSIPDNYKKRIRAFHDDENTYDLMSLSDLCILVQPSTTGLEALALGKPLVHLDVRMRDKLPYSFTEFKVAVKMTPAELGKALSQHTDFSRIIHPDDVKTYLQAELSETDTAIENVINISEKLIQASREKDPKPFQTAVKADKDWSMVVLLSNGPENVLAQLEALAINSENEGTFEVILIEPEDMSKKTSDILDTLKGDVLRLPRESGISSFEMMNQASQKASGKTLLFLGRDLLPLPRWLYHLKRGIKQYGVDTILGAKITDQRGSLVHAGMILDKNHFPVSAYKHLASDFPTALKERPFKMFDHFICIHRAFFHELGGFREKTGKFAFMDICLRADYRKKRGTCFYIPDAVMVSLNDNTDLFNPDDSIYFFGRWQGVLWENQEALYETDKITKADLDAARMAQAIKTADLKY
ncbi:MAG: hypothetical protein M0T82_12230 [Desulfobacteraceae bacterium]|nr:hypothetical protein [Desulfobacteraceae bacterium]